MKKKMMRVTALLLAVATLFAMSVFAAEKAEPSVRVNGSIVTFPDAKPYVDENDRTMIPVRFVSEQLGAKVTWNDKAQSAIITKNGIQVSITIGNENLKVTTAGKTTTVKMDTAAVLKGGRTYVPIRYVAEALGATVDYSDTYQTIGIYAGKLSADQIAMLRSLPYTQEDHAISYESAKANKSAEDLAFYYGTDRAGFDNFANAREHLYHTIARNTKYGFPKIGKTLNNSNADTFYKYVVEEAIAETNYSSANMTVSFIADTSCIYQADSIDNITCAVRGIAKVRLNVKPTELEGFETAKLCKMGFSQLYQGVDMFIPVDVHMSTISGYSVSVHSVKNAGEAY